jgi:hypothetical protein
VNGTELASTFRQEDAAAARAATPASTCAGREPFDVQCVAGRLVELRLFDLSVPDEVTAMNAALRSASAHLGAKAVIVADCRQASPFPHEVGDAWSRAMRRFNGNVIRSAILLDPSNETFNLQIARVIRCAGLPARRWFHDPEEARAFLADVLTELELARLADVLAG